MTARRSVLAALTVALYLPPSVFSSESRDLRLRQAVDRRLDGSSGAIAVVDVASEEILASKNLELVRPRRDTSTDQAVFLGLEHAITYGAAHAASVDRMTINGKTGPASASNSSRTRVTLVGDAPADRPEITVVYLRERRELDAAIVTHSVLDAYGRIKKKP